MPIPHHTSLDYRTELCNVLPWLEYECHSYVYVCVYRWWLGASRTTTIPGMFCVGKTDMECGAEMSQCCSRVCTPSHLSQRNVPIWLPALSVCVQQFAAALARGGGARPTTHGSDG